MSLPLPYDGLEWLDPFLLNIFIIRDDDVEIQNYCQHFMIEYTTLFITEIRNKL